MARYRDRTSAGEELARWLESVRTAAPIILGLPRGGVPVAAAVASALDAPLDVVIVRKLGTPRNPELAMGAVGEGGTLVLNCDVITADGVTARELAGVRARERAELTRRARMLRQGHPARDLLGRTAVIVDDGMATGATAAVACRSAREAGAHRIVVAVPVASTEAVRLLADAADQVVCPFTPAFLGGVGAAFDDFHQLTDREVVDYLNRPRSTF